MTASRKRPVPVPLMGYSAVSQVGLGRRGFHFGLDASALELASLPLGRNSMESAIIAAHITFLLLTRSNGYPLIRPTGALYELNGRQMPVEDVISRIAEIASDSPAHCAARLNETLVAITCRAASEQERKGAERSKLQTANALNDFFGDAGPGSRILVRSIEESMEVEYKDLILWLDRYIFPDLPYSIMFPSAEEADRYLAILELGQVQ